MRGLRGDATVDEQDRVVMVMVCTTMVKMTVVIHVIVSQRSPIFASSAVSVGSTAAIVPAHNRESGEARMSHTERK